MKKLSLAVMAALFLCVSFVAAQNEKAKLHKFSTTVEKERTELNEEIKKLMKKAVLGVRLGRAAHGIYSRRQGILHRRR